MDEHAPAADGLTAATGGEPGGLTLEELEADDVVELPDREAMSIVAPPPIGVPLDVGDPGD